MTDDIFYRVHESEPVATPAAEAAPTFEDLPPMLAGIVDGVIEELLDEKRARRYAIEKLRAEMNTLAAKVDTLITLLGTERARGADVVSLPPWPPKRDAS
jgi:hypothetical protein